MKQIFTIFFLMFFVFAVEAQQVKIRDSVVKSENGTSFTLKGVDYYSYNNSCKLATIIYNGGNAKELINYYPNGNVSENIYQGYDSASHLFVNDFRELYTYNNFGKTITALSQNWDSTSKKYVTASNDSSIYDQNNDLIEELKYQADSTGMLRLIQKRNYYNYNNGNYDSLTIVNYQDSSLNHIQHIKNIYTYYDSLKQNYQLLIFTYDSTNTLFLTQRITNFHDSINYVVSDSIVTEQKTAFNASFLIEYINVLTSIYDMNGVVKESDNGFYFFSTYELDKTYHIYGSCSSVLAVSLIQFVAKQQISSVNLSWQTASEVNTSYFNIQRSSNGAYFNTISKIIAAGNSASTKNYTYTDVNAATLHANKLYYRLQEVDKDGKTNYSNIQIINFAKNKTLFTISPNPAKNFINITSFNNVINAQLNITDMNGRVLYNVTHSFNAGEQIKISTAKLAKQILLVTINAGNEKQQFKVVKE